MSDAHTPNLLSDADAAADLAGVARPSKGLRLLYDYGQAITESGDSEEIYMNYAAAREYIKAMEHERDALAVRVAELESEVLDQCRLNGMGAERELALMGRVAELEAERDRLRHLAKRFYNLTIADPTVIIRPNSEDKRSEVIQAGAELRAALTPTPESKP